MKSNMMGCMVSSPICINPRMELKPALKLMRSKRIRHLPVLHDKRLVGLLSERELKAALSLPQADQLTVGDIMECDVYTVTSDTSLNEVAMEMADRKLGSVLIVNSEDRVIGIFTTTDALRLLADFADSETIGDYFRDEEEYLAWPALENFSGMS